MPQGTEFPEAPMGGWGFVESFSDDVKLRRSPSQVPSLSILPWKMSNRVFSRDRIKATAPSF